MTMSIQSPKTGPRRYTAEQFLKSSDSSEWELVAGKRVRRSMGAKASSIAIEISGLLREYNKAANMGVIVGSDASFQCFPDDPEKLRRADVAFILRGRLPGDEVPDTQIMIAPDLVVEVISPGDRIEALEDKLVDYRNAGVRLIWVVYPKSRKVRVIRLQDPPEQIVELRGDTTITGEDVLPGFSCKVSDFFAI